MALSKRRAREEDNLERWLITYSDMITLLMAFFVMMYAMSVVNKSKFAEMARAVQTELGIALPASSAAVINTAEHSLSAPGSIVPDDFRILAQTQHSLAQNLRDAVMGQRRRAGGADAAGEEAVRDLLSQVQVVARGRDLVLRLAASNILFACGKADLTPAARDILRAVSHVLAPMPNAVRIEGHTCDLPIHTARFPSNWELSAQRAINVLTDLIHQGLSPDRLAAVGYGDTRPLVPNTSEANRRKNRRVDIVVMGGMATLEKAARAREAAAKGEGGGPAADGRGTGESGGASGIGTGGGAGGAERGRVLPEVVPQRLDLRGAALPRIVPDLAAEMMARRGREGVETSAPHGSPKRATTTRGLPG